MNEDGCGRNGKENIDHKDGIFCFLRGFEVSRVWRVL
jgi:hypothetical protein